MNTKVVFLVLVSVSLALLLPIGMVKECIASVETRIYVDPPIVSVFKRATFEVNVTIANVTDLYGFDYRLFWNTIVLDLVKVVIVLPPIWVEFGYIIAMNQMREDYNTTHGRYWLSAGGRPWNPFSGTTTVTTLTFKAVEAGNSTLTLADTKLADIYGEPVLHEVYNGYVQVAQTVLGDVNYDGVVNICDLVIAALAYGSRPGDPNWNPQADLFYDNLIDIWDLVIIGVHYGETW